MMRGRRRHEYCGGARHRRQAGAECGGVLHPVKRKGKQDKGELDLKTDADGKDEHGRSSVWGRCGCKVLAPHFQTFGEDYEVDKPELEITVKLKHPGGQYSVYGQPRGDKKPQ